MSLNPDFYYSEDHEWINARPEDAVGTKVRVGITNVAADRLGEVVFAELPQVGDQVTGITGLAVSMPVAGLFATIVVGPGVVGHLTPHILLIGLGLAVLLPVVPFALELLALRRLTTAAFGTLMALEPGFAMLLGFVVLHQVPGPLGIVGICLVVAAGVGAARTGARAAPVPLEVG